MAAATDVHHPLSICIEPTDSGRPLFCDSPLEADPFPQPNINIEEEDFTLLPSLSPQFQLKNRGRAFSKRRPLSTVDFDTQHAPIP